jgi:hypothetical protein
MGVNFSWLVLLSYNMRVKKWMTRLFLLKRLYRDLVIRMQLSGVSRDKRLKNEHLICQEWTLPIVIKILILKAQQISWVSEQGNTSKDETINDSVLYEQWIVVFFFRRVSPTEEQTKKQESRTYLKFVHLNVKNLNWLNIAIPNLFCLNLLDRQPDDVSWMQLLYYFSEVIT